MSGNSKQRRKAWRKRSLEMLAEVYRVRLQVDNPPPLTPLVRHEMALALMRDTDDEGNPVTPVITTPAEFFAVLEAEIL